MPPKGTCLQLEDENLDVTVKAQQNEAMVYNLNASLPPGMSVDQFGGITELFRLLSALGYHIAMHDDSSDEEEDDDGNMDDEGQEMEEQEVEEENNEDRPSGHREKRKREDEDDDNEEDDGREKEKPM